MQQQLNVTVRGIDGSRLALAPVTFTDADWTDAIPAVDAMHRKAQEAFGDHVGVHAVLQGLPATFRVLSDGTWRLITPDGFVAPQSLVHQMVDYALMAAAGFDNITFNV